MRQHYNSIDNEKILTPHAGPAFGGGQFRTRRTKARKEDGDPALRVSFDKPEWNGLTDHISRLSEIKKTSNALNYGGLRIVVLTNKQVIFERNSGDQRIMVAINMDDNPYTAHFDAGCGQAKELISGTIHDFGGGSTSQPKSSEIWLMER